MYIQWYPGHMTKAKRMLLENIKLVDIVIEILDARIPLSSQNPDINDFCKNKKRIIILNKIDLADDRITKKWVKYFEEKNIKVILINSLNGNGFKNIITVSENIMSEKVERLKKRGRVFVPTRAMIVGIPNVGKSTFINKFIGKSIAKTGAKPGVTRGKQWIKIKKDFELLDTPGILWPKFENEEIGLNLSFTGAINDNIIDKNTLAIKLIDYLRKDYNSFLKERYSIEFNDDASSLEILEKISSSRGFILKNNKFDLTRCSETLIDEFRNCKLGKISLEKPL